MIKLYEFCAENFQLWCSHCRLLDKLSPGFNVSFDNDIDVSLLLSVRFFYLFWKSSHNQPEPFSIHPTRFIPPNDSIFSEFLFKTTLIRLTNSRSMWSFSHSVSIALMHLPRKKVHENDFKNDYQLVTISIYRNPKSFVL